MQRTEREIELEMEVCRLRNEVYVLSGQLLNIESSNNASKMQALNAELDSLKKTAESK